MAKQIKLTEEELNSLKNLQTRGTALRQELSDIGMANLNLTARQSQAEAFYFKTVELERELGKSLEEKYGRGNVDLETGTFIPLQDK